MIITGTESSKGTWTEKRTSVDHYSDRILDRDWTGKGTSYDHYGDRVLERDIDTKEN